MNIYKDDSRLLRRCHAGTCGKKVFGCKRRMTKEWSNEKSISWIQVDEVNTCLCCPYTSDVENCEVKKTVKKFSPDAYCPDCLNNHVKKRRD